MRVEHMNEIYPNLYETDGEFPFAGSPFQTRAFLLVRPEGNLWVYGSGQVEAHAEFIRGKGGIKKQFLSHSDEAGSFCDRTRELFGAPLTCPEQEKEIVSTKCQVDETFNEDGELESGFEFVMTPGHTVGSSCYLWHTLAGNILFIGDNLSPDKDGVWRAILLRKGLNVRDEIIHSLGKIRNLKIDLLVPAGSQNDKSHLAVTQQQWNEIVDDCIARLNSINTSDVFAV
ncbi:MAG: hypothetical protein O7B79_03035 [SAR324 cluster bacterium]|nr:hypothetical protein [SAR324 cluster bacterium]